MKGGQNDMMIHMARLCRLIKFCYRSAVSKYSWRDDNEHIFERYDLDSIASLHEFDFLLLVDFLVHDVKRLGLLVMETRKQVNRLSCSLKHVHIPYPMTAEDVWDCSFDDHPAMLRYLELFE